MLGFENFTSVARRDRVFYLKTFIYNAKTKILWHPNKILLQAGQQSQPKQGQQQREREESTLQLQLEQLKPAPYLVFSDFAGQLEITHGDGDICTMEITNAIALWSRRDESRLTPRNLNIFWLIPVIITPVNIPKSQKMKRMQFLYFHQIIVSQPWKQDLNVKNKKSQKLEMSSYLN